MVIFGTFMIHIGKTRINPRLLSLYWVKKEQKHG
nr:MAG TPA: hypothetical protein [Caudoviricetes sp.]